ncbi:MAG: Fe-S cluster assembly ATPase SufC [Flavobacteriaceae bacterium]|nr:Fe-S cluster assembly ATPase SufC [Flavobacteriaceae bacterium]MCY4268068.1 Fe-S cluster assembly ATPase SufC [Flavobacteriaceae bacterium]
MLRIENLHVSVEDKKILNGIDLHVGPGEVHAIMGPNGSGKSTLAWVIAGNEDYQIEEGNLLFKGQPIEDLDPEERAVQGIFLSFQYPVEIPGVTVTNFIKTSVNAIRKARGLSNMPAGELLQKIRKTAEKLQIDSKFLSRSLNEGFSGGEKKRNEVFQMMMHEPTLSILDETDSGLDIDALKIVARGVNEMRSPKRSTVVITHYERLLEYIVPDYVHVILDGKIVKSGDKTLAQKLEAQGYDWIKNS